MEAQRSLDALPPDECLSLLARAEVGHVAFSYRALPAIVPVHFGVDEDGVVIRTTEESRLADAGNGAVMSFEVDELEPAPHGGWSVAVTGQARRMTDPDEIARWRTRIHPRVPGPRDCFLFLPMTIVTGRWVDL
jgi:nitroimidazol reductase NimA-like FMN-containing flavoprotein (pyridoxamine 5'-phosphate oxidase superfamily)